MTVRWLLVLTLPVLLSGAMLVDPGEPEVVAPLLTTSSARLWREAHRQAVRFETADPGPDDPEAVRMLVAVQQGQRLGAGKGWYGPSRRRHDWQWLAGRFDANHDGRIVAAEFRGPAEFFVRLDRNGDGFISSDDLDWSPQSDWVKRDAESLRMLRAVDRDGNGRVSAMEWQDFFAAVARDTGFLTAGELRIKLGIGGSGLGNVPRDVLLRCLLAGDLGSPHEGPRVDERAPDFTLPSVDGARQVSLADYVGKRPIVLIFGSFT